MRKIYPFPAIVGQDLMKRGLLLNAVNPRIGGILIRGERGTAKSTAARALAALLPDVEVVEQCRFGCDPNVSLEWCTECQEHSLVSGALQSVVKPTPFVDLPVSATEDRVVGTLDIERAIKQGERHFDPGVLASANRGLLYIDEVNLLDDHVVDLLLDSAAMGVNVVEREGISFSHPARFILVGTMNPEEGDLRPQLLDRFALAVDIQGLVDGADRVSIMERILEFESKPVAFQETWQPNVDAIASDIESAREIVDKVTYSHINLENIASLTTSLGVEGHRADLVILRAARAHAALQGRRAINDNDVLIAAQLALPHRVKNGPFDSVGLGIGELEQRLQEVSSGKQKADSDHTEAKVSENQSETKKKEKSDITSTPEDLDHTGAEPNSQHNHSVSSDGHWWEGGRKDEVGGEFEARTFATPLDKLTRQHSGRRSTTRTERKRGRYVQARPANGELQDIAFDATFRAAAPYQIDRTEQLRDVAFAIRTEDLHRKIRVRKSANLVIFVVDASWSMAVSERMSATKGAIVSLLTDAYKRRDRVGLIVFQKNDAILVLPPTGSVQLARVALADIPVGGKTPLSAGLTLAHRVIVQQQLLYPDVVPLMILLTDGAGNVSMTNRSPREEEYQAATLLNKQGIRSIVINMEHAAFDQGLAPTLSEYLGAPCLTLQELRAENLYATVRYELDQL